ncbi:MAG: glycoside hydrolase 43 family protein [Bacteroidales bacterium]|nr:glycoside hydrolase 43 family protein [Bacteroidales bacterium]
MIIRYFLFLIAMTVIACTSDKTVKTLEFPVLGTWGDQGDGTYKNPVLNSNYPDSDVEEYNGKYYMISSKGRYIKGMTILESEDLVNWTIINGIVDSVDWGENVRGVWAGDLVRHEGKWLCYFIDIDKGLFVCESDNIKGKWSHPRLIFEKSNMTDPAVFFDYERKEAYLTCNYEIVRNPEAMIFHNYLFKLSWDGQKLLDKGKEIYVGEGAEAAKIYFYNDYYYIFLSEWTRNKKGKRDDRLQIVLRGKSIYGPYEKKILMERDAVTGRSSCQGSLLQIPDGSWWYLHQLVQNADSYEGRPQMLIPVKWESDWPVLGFDPDGNGIGNTVWEYKKPITGSGVKAPQSDDDFNSQQLGYQWLWDGNPDNTKWSLTDRKGFLRMYASIPTNTQTPIASVPNKLLQRKMGKGKDVVITKIDLSGMAEGQQVGLIHSGKGYASAGIYLRNGEKNVYWNFNNKQTIGEKIKSQTIWLKSVFNGQKGYFEYSEDGERFKSIGKEIVLEREGFDGIFIGMYSINLSGYGYVDVDWFSYDYDGPKSEKLE